VGAALDPQLVTRGCKVARHLLNVVSIHAFGLSTIDNAPMVTAPILVGR
jgi:hypothetical protein